MTGPNERIERFELQEFMPIGKVDWTLPIWINNAGSCGRGWGRRVAGIVVGLLAQYINLQ